jgi:excisionase family DNA binding protein
MNLPPNNFDSWMTVEEVAAYLGLSRSTIYQYVNEHRIPFVKIPTSNQIRFQKARIDEWMADGSVATIADYLNTEVM